MTDLGRKIRICYVLNTFELGGAEMVAVNLARAHDRQRFAVEIVGAMDPPVAGEPEVLRRCREAGVKATSLRQPNLRSPVALFRFFLFLLRGRFDLVMGHNRGTDYWAVRLGRWAGIRHRYWARHLVYQDMNPVHLKRYRSLAGQVHGVVAVSEAVRRSCIETEGLTDVRIDTIENGIDTEQFKPLDPATRQAVRRDLEHPEGTSLLLFVARFAQQKAPEAFIELVEGLHRRGVPVRGYMCGHGPLEDDLRRRAAATDGRVRVLGLRSDIPRLLGSCDLFVSTSRNEGLPLNVMEAMSAGAPFVGPSIPQVQELVQTSAELQHSLFSPPPAKGQVPAEQLEEWADKVAGVLASPLQLDICGKLGRQVIVDHFSLQKMTKRYEEIFLRDLGLER